MSPYLKFILKGIKVLDFILEGGVAGGLKRGHAIERLYFLWKI